MEKLHEGLFTHQEEAKRAKISGRPLLSYSRRALASFILWMDDEFEQKCRGCEKLNAVCREVDKA